MCLKRILQDLWKLDCSPIRTLLSVLALDLLVTSALIDLRGESAMFSSVDRAAEESHVEASVDGQGTSLLLYNVLHQGSCVGSVASGVLLVKEQVVNR